MSFSIFSMLFYLISVMLITPILLKTQSGEHSQKLNKTLFFSTALIAIVLHLMSLYTLINHLFEGQTFTLADFGSLISVIVAILATFAVLIQVKTLWFLLPLVYCFAVINLALAEFAPIHLVQNLAQNTGLLIHIVLALLSYAVCFIAMLYSIQLSWVDHYLKSKKMTFSPIMPPLMAVERHLFRVLMSGELLLTLTLISGAVHLADFFGAQNIQKAIFSFLAWLVFGLLLIGHWKWHWRGKRMIICTISGMILLSIAYFGSRAMLDSIY